MNEPNELFVKINKIIEFFGQAHDILFKENYYIIQRTEENKKKLNGFSIPFEAYGNDLRIQFKKHFKPEKIKYASEIDNEIEPEDVNSNFLVIDAIHGSIISYEAQSKELSSFGNTNKELEKSLNNIICYFLLYNFLKSNTFSDYFNDANNEIVFYSSAKGIFKIKYKTRPNFKYSEDISGKVGKLIEYGTPLQFRIFFKNAIFSYANTAGVISIDEIISNGFDIITVTERDYELVSKQFDFKNFRDSLYKEKEKYFSNIREIINKIFSQAVGIPISISATVFATYKVSDDGTMLCIVLLAFLIYIAFYIKIQLIYRADIKEIENDFNNDFDVIKSNSGLDFSLIQKEKTKIETKIKNSLSMIDWLIGIVIGLGILVCFYIFYEITKLTPFSFIIYCNFK